ncbi:MAG: exodeoxyribonuclease III [Holosporales bacterium]|jgi:exodeoxyribonuclease-3|nr:exodeoxyribonuclease III [Holosporales bacterium]
MKIATWNVNSVRARLDAIDVWLKKENPTVVLLQELKCQEAAFPFSFFEERGFTCAVLGQKTYNGVAIVAQTSIEDVTCGLPNFANDQAARYIEAVVDGGVRVASVYVPNGGNVVGAEPYAYKLDFLTKLTEHMLDLSKYDESIFIGGDYNITTDVRDVYDEKLWFEKVCCTTTERNMLKGLKGGAFFDVLDVFWQKANPTTGKRPFTWWDYRMRSAEWNKGLRLDYFMANQAGLDSVSAVTVDIETRKAKQRVSDHAPLIIETRS